MNIEYTLLTFQLLNLILLVLWLVLIGLSLYHLRKAPMPDHLQLIWVLVILLVPIVGALAYLIMRKKPQSR